MMRICTTLDSWHTLYIYICIYSLQGTNTILPWEKENHLQKGLGRGYVSSQEEYIHGIYYTVYGLIDVNPLPNIFESSNSSFKHVP